MKAKRFSEEEITGALKEAKGEVKTADLTTPISDTKLLQCAIVAMFLAQNIRLTQ